MDRRDVQSLKSSKKYKAKWTVSDPVNVEISSADNNTNGLATCLGATNGPATVTATVTQGGVSKTATGSITCK